MYNLSILYINYKRFHETDILNVHNRRYRYEKKKIQDERNVNKTEKSKPEIVMISEMPLIAFMTLGSAQLYYWLERKMLVTLTYIFTFHYHTNIIKRISLFFAGDEIYFHKG